ncbi:MAG: hypothetical protein H6Q62_591, partial [Firmicutes bacterium]|nr:hypothetical protein [Bacillota bacterium]
ACSQDPLVAILGITGPIVHPSFPAFYLEYMRHQVGFKGIVCQVRCFQGQVLEDVNCWDSQVLCEFICEIAVSMAANFL